INAGGAIQTSATNTYTGITSIAAAAGGVASGIFLVSGPGSIASSAGVVNNGVVDISRAWQSVAIQSLSGNGQVYLGGQNLNITNGSGTFSGTISDGGSVYGYPGVAGSLTISGGTQVLSGASAYTGVTTVIGGQLVLNGSVTSDVFVIGGGLSGTGTI